MHKKTKRKNRALAALIAVLAMLLCFTNGAMAQSAWPREDTGDIRADRHDRIPIRLEDGTYVGSGYLINETTYAPVRTLCAALCACRVTYDASTRTATVEAEGLYMSARDGDSFIRANGRYLYTDTPVKILDDGRMYVPVRVLARALGVSVTWDGATRTAEIGGDLRPILSGDRFYREDEVYWLSRIISAESRGEPLLGQIAVGNVVLNRMRSGEYPGTIWGVIFDRKYGTQFSPVANGSVYDPPYYLSVIAAKLCLEGVTVSENVLFFYEPNAATSFWIPANRRFAFRIGNHSFFY